MSVECRDVKGLEKPMHGILIMRHDRSCEVNHISYLLKLLYPESYACTATSGHEYEVYSSSQIQLRS